MSLNEASLPGLLDIVRTRSLQTEGGQSSGKSFPTVDLMVGSSSNLDMALDTPESNSSGPERYTLRRYLSASVLEPSTTHSSNQVPVLPPLPNDRCSDAGGESPRTPKPGYLKERSQTTPCLVNFSSASSRYHKYIFNRKNSGDGQHHHAVDNIGRLRSRLRRLILPSGRALGGLGDESEAENSARAGADLPAPTPHVVKDTGGTQGRDASAVNRQRRDGFDNLFGEKFSAPADDHTRPFFSRDHGDEPGSPSFMNVRDVDAEVAKDLISSPPGGQITLTEKCVDWLQTLDIQTH